MARIPPHPPSLGNFVLVVTAKQCRKYAWGMFCESEGVRLGWFGSDVRTDPKVCSPCGTPCVGSSMVQNVPLASHLSSEVDPTSWAWTTRGSF